MGALHVSAAERLQVRAGGKKKGNSCVKCGRLALPEAQPPPRTQRRRPSLAPLITIPLCLPLSLRTPSEVILCLSADPVLNPLLPRLTLGSSLHSQALTSPRLPPRQHTRPPPAAPPSAHVRAKGL